MFLGSQSMQQMGLAESQTNKNEEVKLEEEKRAEKKRKKGERTHKDT